MYISYATYAASPSQSPHVYFLPLIPEKEPCRFYYRFEKEMVWKSMVLLISKIKASQSFNRIDGLCGLYDLTFFSSCCRVKESLVLISFRMLDFTSWTSQYQARCLCQ